MDKRKILIIKLSGALTALLLLLTFFSNTIHNLNVPGVVVGARGTGVTSSITRSEGLLEFPDNIGIYAEYSGRFVLAAFNGDRVDEGDLLFTIHADVDNILERLETDNDRLARVLLNRTRNQTELAQAQSQLATLSPAPFLAREIAMPDLSTFDHEETRLAAEIDRARDHLATQQILFNAGGIAQAALTEATHRLETLEAQRERNAQSRAIIMENYQRNLATAEEENRISQEQISRNLENERTAINRRIGDLQLALQLLDIEEAEIRRQITEHQERIDEDGVAHVYAEFSAIVQEIPGGPQTGSFIDRGRRVFSLALEDENTYHVTAFFHESLGITAEPGILRQTTLNIPALRENGIPGIMQRVTPEGGRLRADISFQLDRNVFGGERIEVVVEDFSMQRGEVLPNYAIRQDAAGDFILYLEREANTLLGYSYFARRMPINVVQRGDRSTAFVMLLDELEGPIILRSDRPISAGDRVRMIGEE